MPPAERRAVLDHNVVVSALVFRGGNPRRVLELVLGGRLQLVTSNHLLTELEDLLVGKFHFSAAAAREVRVELEFMAVLADPAHVPPVCRDPDDDHVLAVAAAGRTNWIVTGDKDLLDMGSHRGVEIITPADLVALAQDW